MIAYFLGAANPETIRMIGAVQRVVPNFSVGGFLDNASEKQGRDFYGYPVVGGTEKVRELANEDTAFVNLITGDVRVRHQTTDDILRFGGRLFNFIHPSVDLTMVTVGRGLYLQEAVVVQAGVEIGDNVSIHIGAMIGHETRIDQSTFVAHAVSVSGSCHIGMGTFIGTNATILPRLSIGKWCVIGAGSVVTKDIPDYSVAVGNPARVIRTLTPP